MFDKMMEPIAARLRADREQFPNTPVILKHRMVYQQMLFARQRERSLSGSRMASKSDAMVVKLLLDRFCPIARPKVKSTQFVRPDARMVPKASGVRDARRKRVSISGIVLPPRSNKRAHLVHKALKCPKGAHFFFRKIIYQRIADQVWVHLSWWYNGPKMPIRNYKYIHIFKKT